MTGRDLIIYILQNGLEDEEVFKDGKYLGFMSAPEAAVKFNTGVATIMALCQEGKIKGIYNNNMLYIPADCKLEELDVRSDRKTINK